MKQAKILVPSNSSKTLKTTPLRYHGEKDRTISLVTITVPSISDKDMPIHSSQRTAPTFLCFRDVLLKILR